jgi:hypothetical protein
MLYGGAPRAADVPTEPRAPVDASPINVPAPGAQAPKAVTQAPPWDDGSAKIDLTIPRAPPAPLPPMRPRADSIEEITGSVLLAEDSIADVTQRKPKVEDLSASYLISDDASGLTTATPLAPPLPAPRSDPQPSEASDAEASHAEPHTPVGSTLQSPPALAPSEMDAPSAAVEGSSTRTAPKPETPAVEAPRTERDPEPASPPEGTPAEATAEGELPLQPFPAVAPPSPSRRVIHDLTEFWADSFWPRVKDRAGHVLRGLAELWAEPKKRWLLGVMGGGVLLVLIGLVGLIIRIARPSPADEPTASPAPAVTVPSPTAAALAPSAASPSPEPSERAEVPSNGQAASPSLPVVSTTPCSLGGSAHVVAPKAHIRMGVEAIAAHNRIALGFVIGEKEGLAVALDPSSLVTTATARHHSREPIKRVVPELNRKSLAAIGDADRKADRIAAARTVPGDSSFVLGEADGKLVWGAQANDAPQAIWALESDAPVEALRAEPMDDGGDAIAFRQGAAIYLGAIHADKTPKGTLVRIAGLGPQIGSPALAVSANTVLVVWADRASTSDPWMLRLLRWQPGEAPGAPHAFAIPPGGMGEQAMSPGIAGLAAGRFLLSWTEGPVASHQVRAQTLSASGDVLGMPLTISGEGINAGQGQPAVLPDGNGVVAYMASPAGGTAEVVATPVQCPSSAP